VLPGGIRPLREPSTIGNALTEGRKAKAIQIAVMRPEWETAYFATILYLNTTPRGCELKGLQWSDVDLLAKTVANSKSKTVAGEQIVPLTDVAAGKAAREGRGIQPGRTVGLRRCGVRPEDQDSAGSGRSTTTCTAFDQKRHLNSWRSAWKR
jgi:hypothetical protein